MLIQNVLYGGENENDCAACPLFQVQKTCLPRSVARHLLAICSPDCRSGLQLQQFIVPRVDVLASKHSGTWRMYIFVCVCACVYTSIQIWWFYWPQASTAYFLSLTLAAHCMFFFFLGPLSLDPKYGRAMEIPVDQPFVCGTLRAVRHFKSSFFPSPMLAANFDKSSSPRLRAWMHTGFLPCDWLIRCLYEKAAQHFV